MNTVRLRFSRMLLLVPAAWIGTAFALPPAPADSACKAATARSHGADHSGKKRVGKASYYSHKFAGKPMASGKTMNPQSNVAASKTLPLGTTARVTNLETGKSAVVKIEDRGPYEKDRIVDLSPKTAKDIGIGAKGVAPVEVVPLKVPQPDGTIKPGAAAAEIGQKP